MCVREVAGPAAEEVREVRQLAGAQLGVEQLATDPEFLERIRNSATSFTVSEGETKSVDLKVRTAP